MPRLPHVQQRIGAVKRHAPLLARTSRSAVLLRPPASGRAPPAFTQRRHHLRQFERAKGRVERAHKTLQDRLVKELRLAGASTLADGNTLLPAFIADYNARFAKPPVNSKDLHRPLRGSDDLEDAFAWKEERTLSQALTLQCDRVIFILEPSEQAKAAIGKRVTVVDYPDGRLSIRYKGVELAYRTFDKMRPVSQGAIIDNKRLGAVLARYEMNSCAAGPNAQWAAAARSGRCPPIQGRLSSTTSVLALARRNNGCGFQSGRRSRPGAALRAELRARPPPDPNGSDISIWLDTLHPAGGQAGSPRLVKGWHWASFTRPAHFSVRYLFRPR